MPLNNLEGSIAGTVVDGDSKSPLQGVLITAKGLDVVFERIIFSDAGGNFAFPPLPLGLYTMSFVLDGYDPQLRPEVTVRSATVTQVDQELPPQNDQPLGPDGQWEGS